ncbi:NAD-dependent epimerase/dehydratase family protein [Acidisoma sp. C75]
MPEVQKIAFVTGATGGAGGAVAEALLARGWRVRGLTRKPRAAAPAAAEGGRIEWITGDAMNAEHMRRAAEGATILFHGANPPGYRNWRGLAVPMLANAIAAAQSAGARLIYPGSVYVYGPDAWGRAAEDAPQHPRTRKGAIRVEMEAMMAKAAARSGLRTLIVRAGDFFGPGAPSSWVSTVMLGNGKPLRAIRTPERPGTRHAWAYLPDLAETIALLAERERSLPAEARFHFAGHVLQGCGMAEALSPGIGGGLPVRAFPWALVYAAAPFVTVMRELIEMRYLWREEVLLDNRALVAELGAEPHTPLAEAIAATLSRRDGG